MVCDAVWVAQGSKTKRCAAVQLLGRHSKYFVLRIMFLLIVVSKWEHTHAHMHSHTAMVLVEQAIHVATLLDTSKSCSC